MQANEAILAVRERVTASVSTHYRELAKHSGVYAFGLILQRLASLLLLPVYTRYLPPEQYGAIALLDSLTSGLDILISRGVVLAMARMHSAASDERQRDTVWWTALGLLVSSATLFTATALIIRSAVAGVILGSDVAGAPHAVTLVLVTLWFNSIGSLLETHLRILKWSTSIVIISMARLVLNASLNLLLLIHFNLGMFAVLTGNLLTTILLTVVLLGTFVRIRGPVRLGREAARAIMAYGSPLILTTMLAFITHQADRFLLRLFVPVSAVGIYSVAYQFAQGINALVGAPFHGIWGIVKFEIAASDSSEWVFGRIADVFATCLLIVLLTASLFASPILSLLTGPAYRGAAALVPLICLGYFFFSVSSFVTLPAELTNQTSRLIPGTVFAAVTNIVANLILIPRLGVVGAAWATVLTFAVLLTGNFVFCRGARAIALPFRQIGAKLALAVLVGVVAAAGRDHSNSLVAFWVAASLAWVCALAVFAMSMQPRLLLAALRRPSSFTPADQE